MKDITLQLVEEEPGKNTDIILGGGLASFLPYYGLYNNSETNRDGHKKLQKVLKNIQTILRQTLKATYVTIGDTHHNARNAISDNIIR